MEPVSEILTAFKASNAWSDQYELPLVPGANNPWIYGAYAMKLMRLKGLKAAEDMELMEKWEAFADGCRLAPGLLNRWPDGSGGVTSHDEIMGMAYLFPDLAREILSLLLSTDGIYCNKPNELQGVDPEKFNLSRMVWLKPYLMACAGYRVGLVSQAVWSASIMWDGSSYKAGDLSDSGGRLRQWLMFEPMSRFPISNQAIGYWKNQMRSKAISLAACFSIEPGECPVFKGSAAGMEF